MWKEWPLRGVCHSVNKGKKQVVGTEENTKNEANKSEEESNAIEEEVFDYVWMIKRTERKWQKKFQTM